MSYLNKGKRKESGMKELRVLNHIPEENWRPATFRSAGFNVPIPGSPNYGPTLRGLYALNPGGIPRYDTLTCSTLALNSSMGPAARKIKYDMGPTGHVPRESRACFILRAMDRLRGFNKTNLTPKPGNPTRRLA